MVSRYSERMQEHPSQDRQTQQQPISPSMHEIPAQNSPILKTLQTSDEGSHDRIVSKDATIPEHLSGNKALKDLLMDQIAEDKHEIKNIEEIRPVMREESDKKDDEIHEEIVDVADVEIHEETVQHSVEEPVAEGHSREEIVVENHVPEEKIEDEPVQTTLDEVPLDEAPKLDSERLVKLMEEDGKLEERTREIKEKPKNVKPKEEYAENSIDLSAMFNVHK
jgi:hypothetical protein